MHPHLKKLREEYEQLTASIETLQNRCVNENNRDMTEIELRSLKEMTELAEAKYTQITDLSNNELRTSKVRQVAALVDAAIADGTDADATEFEFGGAAGTVQVRRVGGARTQDRDPGHYRSVKAGGTHSFFTDLYRSKDLGDEDAAKRLVEHNRSLTTGTAGAGVVAPHWLIEEYAPMARQGRALANAVRQVPLGTDPRPLTLPKQSTGADGTNPIQQANENDAAPATDKWASAVDTVVPKPTRGEQVFSRQLLDMATPAIDVLIYGDLIAEYNRQVEAAVGAALVTASGTAVATFATETAFVGTLPAVPASDAIVDAAVAVWDGRKLPADILAMNVKRYGKFKKLRDSQGRKLIPEGSGGTVNVDGVGSITVPGEIESLPIVVTESTNIGPYPDNILVLRGSDTLLFESSLMQFRYEEVSGPDSIKLGIWGYMAVLVRYAGLSSKRIVVTAA